MAFFKWGLPSLIVVLLGVALLTTKTFHVERVIETHDAVIWEILTDTERYYEMEPGFRRC